MQWHCSIRKIVDRRFFLKGFIAAAGIYCVRSAFGVLFLPAHGLAKDGPLSPPSFGGPPGEKAISEKEFDAQLKTLVKKWDANAKAYKKELTPEEKKRQREKAEQSLRTIIKSNGYEISAPTNLRVISP